MRIALYQPDIPQNAGTILRLGACLSVPVDIIEPSGFPLSHASLKMLEETFAVDDAPENVWDFHYLRVRDAEGTEGWIYQSLLSGRRTAVIAPWQRSKSRLIPLYDEPSSAARTVARMVRRAPRSRRRTRATGA